MTVRLRKHREGSADLEERRVLHDAVVAGKREMSRLDQQRSAAFHLFQNFLPELRLVARVSPIQAPQLDEHGDPRGDGMIVPHQPRREPRAAFVPAPHQDHVPRRQEEILPAGCVVGVEEDSGQCQARDGQLPDGRHSLDVARIERDADAHDGVARDVRNAAQQLLGDAGRA